MGTLCSKKGVIYIFWEFSQKIVKRQTPGESFPAELSKLLSTIPEEQCGCILFLKKYQLLFFGFWVNNSAVSPKVFRQRCENCKFFVFRGTFSMRKVFYKIYKILPFFGLGVKFFGVSAKRFQRDCKNCILQVRGRSFVKKVFLKVHSFKNNFGLFKKDFDFSSGICSNVVIYALYVSKWTFRARNVTWKFYEFVCSSWLWAENVGCAIKECQQGHQKFIPHFQRIIIGEQFLYWKKHSFVNIFGHWAKLFWRDTEKLAAV